MSDQVQKLNFHFDNPRPDLVTMRSGRKGEWNEYVEFQAYNSEVVFVAQLCYGDGVTNVYENHPGRKGRVAPVKLGLTAPIFAIEIAYEKALEQAQAA